MRAKASASSGETPLPRAEELARLPVVALVGRPNTGKSTLFNRLTRSRRALVAPEPGVTRDRNIGVARYDERHLMVVDTGGFEADEREELARAVRTQALIAADAADAVVVVVDGRAGLSPLDRLLLERRGEVVSRRELLELVWGYRFDPGTNVVDVHVARLRGKLEAAGLEDAIRTKRGLGYVAD